MGSGKTSRLIQEATQLLEQHPTDSVLILCSNHARQQRFKNELLNRVQRPLGHLPVYTYAGHVRNTLFNYWPLVDQMISTSLKAGKSAMTPQLSGLEDSEFILNRSLDVLKEKANTLLSEFPGTRRGLLKQLIRRIRLRSENWLSREEMTRRSQLLDEMCIHEIAEVEKQFDRMSYCIRVLDPNKQLDVFHWMIESNATVQEDFTRQIRHLIVDDVDETIPAEQRFIEFIAPTLDSLLMAADIDGGSRRGYLNAYPYDWEKLKLLREGEVVRLERTDPVYADAQRLLSNWKRSEGFEPLEQTLVMNPPTLTQVEMMDRMVEDLYGHLELGYSPGDFAVVLPETDPLIFFRLKNKLNQRGIRVQLLSGTKRPLDNPICRGLIYLLQLVNSEAWGYRLSPIEIKTILNHLLQLQSWDRQGVDVIAQRAFSSSQGLTATVLPTQAEILAALERPLPPLAEERYRILLEWIERVRRMPFEKQMFAAFSDIVTPFVANEDERFVDLNQWIQSYARQKWIHDNLKALTPIPEDDAVGMPSFDRLWLAQIKTGSMADTPESPEDPDDGAVVVGSPQKIIDLEIRRKIQLWMDIGSRQWARSDDAPLYNAWVHSAVWDGSTSAFSEDFKESIIRTRAAHITRTLMMLATERVRAYDSELDHEGNSQVGLLKPRLIGGEDLSIPSEPQPRAILREDQQPVLDYRTGTMAITAVPGAGKTFINVEMILELIERGISPDRILVLTYMDSAAKTLLGRLRHKLPAKLTNNGKKLPVVSTIHSLAFRILTENDHALALGFLPEDIEILEDHTRDEVLNRVAFMTQPQSVASVNQWVRGISRGINYAKMQGLSPDGVAKFLKKATQNFRLLDFLPAYQAYQDQLKEAGRFDFTDLILKAVELLEQNPEIRAKYQAQFEYIIEDEAQDSSLLLQRLINNLGGERPNLIRTGDPNQSITTTFSSADPSVFRNFIRSADLVVRMSYSGRCAPEVIALANQWILLAEQNPTMTGAFETVAMQPVPDRNPRLLYPITAKVFEMDRQETDWLVQSIRGLRAEHPDASIAVLVRRNEDVLNLAGTLQQADIPAISLTDTLNSHPVFNVLAAYLHLLESPSETERQVILYDRMIEAGITDANPEYREFLETQALLYLPMTSVRNEFLLQLYYDLLDFSRDASGSNLCKLIIRMTDRLFHSVGDRSNGYLCALWAQDILKNHAEMQDLSPLEIVNLQFKSYQKSRRRKKGFAEALNGPTNEFVQVMSLHKSKGQEFDVVFMPYLTSRLFPSKLEEVSFKEEEKLVQELDRVIAGGVLPPDYPERLKRSCIQEEARLLYVGLSRARRGLFMTTHTQGIQYGKIKAVEPAWGFQALAATLPQASAIELVPLVFNPIQPQPVKSQAEEIPLG